LKTEILASLSNTIIYIILQYFRILQYSSKTVKKLHSQTPLSSWNIEAATGDLTSHPTLHQTTRCKKGRLAHTRDGMDLEWRPPACLCRLACGQSRHGMAWGSEPAFSPSPISDETALCRHAASHQPRRRRRWEQSRAEEKNIGGWVGAAFR
jgi:hypothetical protein